MKRHYYAGIKATLAKCEMTVNRFVVNAEIHAFDGDGNLHRITFEWSKRSNRGWLRCAEIHRYIRLTPYHLNPEALRKACDRVLRGEPWAGVEYTERFRMSHWDYCRYLIAKYNRWE